MKFKKQMAALVAALMLAQGIPVYVMQPVKIVASEQITTIVDSLYQDSTYTKIKTNVTQAQIDRLVTQAEAITDGGLKTVTMVRLTNATEQLQEMRFTGLSNNHFATFAFYTESGIAQYRTNAVKPHSGISSLYLSIEVKDENGNTTFKREAKGTDQLTAETTDVALKEGYTVDIYKCEPSRFLTNHDDVLKHDDSNPYRYKVVNGKLVRLNKENRTFTFMQNDQPYASVKVDFNAKKLYFELFEGVELNEETSITVLGYNSEELLKKTFTAGVSEKGTFEFVFAPNHSVKFEGNVTVRVSNDEGIINDMSIQNGSKIVVSRSGLYHEVPKTEVEMQVYKQSFLKQITESDLSSMIEKGSITQDFVDWFLNNIQAMKNYNEAGNASSIQLGTMNHFGYNNYPFSLENEEKALAILNDIYEVDGENLSGMKLKMAIAVSKEFANGVQAWMGGSMIDALERYELYAQSYDDGVFYDDFGALTSADLRNVVVCQITNEDILWLRNYIETEKPEMLARNRIVSGHSLLVYRDKNPETGESIHGPNFYGPNPTIQEVIKWGGVCGTMSKFSVVLAQAYGIPALAVGQPGHCAYQYLNPNGEYGLGYDVYGWEQSGNWNTTFPYLKINAELNKNRARFEESEYYRHKAIAADTEREKIENIVKAVEIEPLNYLAWEEYLEYSASGVMEYYMMCNKIEDALSDYPVIVENLTGKQTKANIEAIFNEEGYLSDTVTLDQLNNLQTSLDKLMDGPYKEYYQEMITRAKDSLKQFKLTGISHRNVVTIHVYEDGSDRVRVETAAGQPHYSFGENYIVVDIYDENSTLVLNKAIAGNVNIEAASEMLTLKDGSRMKFTIRETFRINTPDDDTMKVLKDGSYTYVKQNGTFVLE